MRLGYFKQWNLVNSSNDWLIQATIGEFKQWDLVNSNQWDLVNSSSETWSIQTVRLG